MGVVVNVTTSAQSVDKIRERPTARSVGRPRVGKPTTVRLPPEMAETLDALGRANGGASRADIIRHIVRYSIEDDGDVERRADQMAHYLDAVTMRLGIEVRRYEDTRADALPMAAVVSIPSYERRISTLAYLIGAVTTRLGVAPRDDEDTRRDAVEILNNLQRSEPAREATR